MPNLAETLARFTSILDSHARSPAEYRAAARQLPMRSTSGTDRGRNAQLALSKFTHLSANAVGDPPARARAFLMAATLERFASDRAGIVLPQEIESLYPHALGRCSGHIESGLDAAYASAHDDAFVKDVRIALGFSVPAGAQDIDLDSAIRIRSLLKHAAVVRDLSPFARLWRDALAARWYKIHTDSRDLSEFNEAGWIRCYERMATLMIVDRESAGVSGTSWFFDPQLDEVSPRLTYLRRIPLDGGAVLIRNGPGAIHTERATATSESRRRLVSEGRYLPTCYTVLWPRAALLEWARLRGVAHPF
jgi:hypothetical protein